MSSQPVRSLIVRPLRPPCAGPAAVDEHGLDVDLAEQRCRRPKLIYVTPAHQFPLGATMPIGRRLSLLEWAGRRGALIFEDDYNSEYRFAGRPIPAIQGRTTRTA